MTEVLSFSDAITDSAHFSKRHLLLGNGFSIACRPDIFLYASLFEQADITAMPNAQALFEALDTQDFEVAIRALETSAQVLPVYGEDCNAYAEQMLADASTLKDVLVSTVAGNHPNIPMDIPDAQFYACRDFLRFFLGGEQSGHVFTLNYDLLLYWALMHEDNPFNENATAMRTNDGFGNDEDDPETEYVVWQGETSAHSADVHYLHGALHLFDAGYELQKYTWIRSDERLIDQARTAMDQERFPLFVAEGTSRQKFTKIRHNAYLYQGLKVLTSNARTRNHCFFIFGHSLALNDDHILKRLGRGKFKKLYISIFGDPNSEANAKIIQRAEYLQTLRAERTPLDLAYYDAASANVWGAA